MNQPIGVGCRLDEAEIIARLADQTAQRITRRTVRALQGMRGDLLSGDHSGLSNVWEEYCVQVQSEESFAWDVYVETVSALVDIDVRELPEHELVAVWLQTDEGIDWRWEDDPEQRDRMVIEYNCVTEYIMDRYLSTAAEKWSNRRIRDFLARRYE